MKLSMGAFFGSSKKSSEKKKTRSISCGDASFASTGTSSSSDDSTPRSVLPAFPGLPPAGKPRSAAGSEDFWLLNPASSSVTDLFAVFDRDGDGKITRQELEAVLRRLGGADPPTEEEVASMVAEVDRDGDGCISLEEFGAIRSAFGPPAGAELREAFTVFDADGDGKISAEELLGVFVTLGDDGWSLEDCRRMIGEVDTDGDGFVCFEGLREAGWGGVAGGGFLREAEGGAGGVGGGGGTCGRRDEADEADGRRGRGKIIGEKRFTGKKSRAIFW